MQRVGGNFWGSGLQPLDRGELLGALMALTKVPLDDPEQGQWKRAGDALLAERMKLGMKGKTVGRCPTSPRSPRGRGAGKACGQNLSPAPAAKSVCQL